MNLDRWCRIESSNIIVEVLKQPEFEIPLSKCNAHSQILAWTHHFLGFRDVNTATVNRFIRLVCEHHKLPLPALAR